MVRYIDKSSLLRVLECTRTVFHRASTALASYPELDSLIRELWGCAHVTSSVAEESLLQVSLIKTIFDTSIICASSGTNRALAGILSEVRTQLLNRFPFLFGNDLLNLHRSVRRPSNYAKEGDHSLQLLQAHSEEGISVPQILFPRVNGSSIYLRILSTSPQAKNQNLLLRSP